MKKVLVLGIDTFAAKNILQVESMARLGYSYTIATTDTFGDSTEFFNQLSTADHTMVVLSKNAFVRLAQLKKMLDDGPYNHVELYAAGRFTLFYMMFLRYYQCRWIVVERGDIGALKSYPRLTRYLARTAYKAATAVWYKEPYMRPLLRQLGAKRLYFVPNAATVHDTAATCPRDLDFLWANRLIGMRHPEWIIHALKDKKLAGCKAAMLGFQDDAQCDAATRRLQNYIRSNCPDTLELRPFIDPRPWYCRARFFLLPARLAFGNNALLEAMACGVIPLVTESPGIRDLITDGVNGFIVQRDETAFQEAMSEAYQLDPSRQERMSRAAITVIKDQFGLDSWTDRTRQMYDELDQPSHYPRTKTLHITTDPNN